jgi:hypothetical protein
MTAGTMRPEIRAAPPVRADREGAMITQAF